MQENYYALFLALTSPELIRADDAFRSLAHGEFYQRKHYKRKQAKDDPSADPDAGARIRRVVA